MSKILTGYLYQDRYLSTGEKQVWELGGKNVIFKREYIKLPTF